MAGLLACYCCVMIPYDDLVAALTAWRARQGLPIGQATAQSAAAAPPAPPPARKPAPPPPAGSRLAPAVVVGDLEDGALIEDASYDAGDDYVMQLGVESAEPTAISGAPEPPAKRGKRDRW